FTTGWMIGWGFIRLRYWSVVVAVTLLCACIFLIAKSKTDTVFHLMQAFAPALLYSVYIIFTAEQIYSYKDKSQRFWWFLSRRLAIFSVLAALILAGVYFSMKTEIEETVANYGGGGKAGKNSMLNQKKDGTFDLKDYSRLQSSLGRSNELLFAAYIDNFFPNTEIPNPLYLTAFYYTKFDTLTETFERDSTIPYNDLFEPDPSKIPLFTTKTDSSVIKNSLGEKLRRTVEIQVYSKQLSPTTYVAPHTGFFVQPITIEKDFKDEFKTAFRAKGYVSELNSAYFIYNPQENKELHKFQAQRFEVLRKVTSYQGMDNKFMSYYTFMPQDVKFQNIANLAKQVTEKSKTPVDKVLAIRDWFLSKDENGEPLFKYTDNPGVPDIPSASKLSYFLFENRKGYCAYYAGATLFMLRALGIPSRIAVGFLTVDRSDKNKGWYWYYADQAHAWVQVYFPGYGWLDFDTTVGNSDAQESPKPDGTPPMQPPRAWLAATGIVQDVDTLKKLMTFQIRQMVFHDKEYQLETPVAVTMDMKIASVKKDSLDVPLASIEKGENATAVSYAEAFKKMEAGNQTGNQIIKRFPNPAPVDEVYLKRKDLSKPEEKPQTQKPEEKVSFERVLWTIGVVVVSIIIFLLLLPTLIFRYYVVRYNSAAPNVKSYWAYRAATFWLHQVGIYRGELTPMQYASKEIDPQFGTSFTPFMNIYLKQKYAKQPLTALEQQTVAGFLKPFIAKLRSKIKAGKRFAGFINPLKTVSFYVRQEEDKE
ncbi:MAG TPA: transglutaminase-like domain-containing protein, partial [Flavipsychrobacter sp.]|nr:transglutaminase-like domain-containing protein [Flavipsychrobacter sp.]